ncbi:PaaX family transcriptional regulator C-terminal domain-containing protein [Mycolicibacterium brumae]|uniref:PaaX domain-containing protein, C-domain protein n=1 Tax=Mycolicibacterium brumae TaxID=85968 RepID=A0A2G5PHX6_9MYCO|nr:PaaX family transcriptional regulator C-terminal domain-containing protein [Mycolicibacterium brumae]MCV7192380.1 PaaX domain-containing protein, C- domain protein [Mycolicibacterium brumae]PIB77760.1 PaaX domain-containing protein, C- domain protein [Mycolicibacterium brumae]UWW10149.1 PaaX domain-containing protein, C- domain protein [Mycolicibacterium brumae]
MPGTRRLTARSVVLSVLLGAHPASATAAELIRLTRDFGIRESTLRVALSRMEAAGDLIRADDGYRLADRLLARQRRQDAALEPSLRDWDGSWTTLVITAVGADARSRADLRARLRQARFGELREGVWLRPANLEDSGFDDLAGRARVLSARDDDPAALAAALWDLDGWAGRGRDLLAALSRADDVPARFAVAAAIVRHLLTDPVLPTALLPPDWPGDQLRAAYREFAADFARRLASTP